MRDTNLVSFFAGLTLEIFQYLHEQYMITVDGFIAWEESEMEPEGKGMYNAVCSNLNLVVLKHVH